MKITIDVPTMSCAKCSIEAPIQPVFLYVKSTVPPQFREALNDVVKEREDVIATDSSNREWAVFADFKPVSWTKGPGQVDLCPTCTALWAEAGKAFLNPPVPEIVEIKTADPSPEPPKLSPVAALVERQIGDTPALRTGLPPRR